MQTWDQLQIHFYTIVTKLRIKIHFSTILLIIIIDWYFYSVIHLNFKTSSKVFSLGFILQKLLLKTCLNITISSNHYVVFYETVFICALQTKVNNLTCYQSPQSFPAESNQRSYLRFRVLFCDNDVGLKWKLTINPHTKTWFSS